MADTKLGISPTTRFDFFGGIVNGLTLFWNSLTAVFVTFKALFTNSQITINELSGPVGIYAVIKQYLEIIFSFFYSFYFKSFNKCFGNSFYKYTFDKSIFTRYGYKIQQSACLFHL